MFLQEVLDSGYFMIFLDSVEIPEAEGLNLPFLKLRLPCVTHSNLSNGYSSRTSVFGKRDSAWFCLNVCMRKKKIEPQFINHQNEHSAANPEIQGSSHYFSGQFAYRE